MIRIGVVGLGFMGSTHLQAWSQVSNAQLVAVASGDPRKLEGDLSQVGGNLGTGAAKVDFTNCARYSNPESLFADPSVDAVDLCVPTHLHAPLAIQALQAGKHVLVEKPMALNPAHAEQMLRESEKAGRILMVAQVLRFWPDYVRARSELAEGSIGSLQMAVFRRKCGAPTWNPWIHDAKQSGGGAFDLLIHDFDFCIHLFGMPAEVRATGSEQKEHGIDILEAELTYSDGPIVVVSGGWQPGDYPFSMEFTLTGSEGTLDYHSGLRRLSRYLPGKPAEEFELTEGDGFRAELQAFADACERGTPDPLCPPSESAQALQLALAAVESRRSGRPIAP